MVINLEQDADLHVAQLMSLPLTVSCFSEIQIGFTFLLPAHPGSPGKRAVKWLCVLLCPQHDFVARVNRRQVRVVSMQMYSCAWCSRRDVGPRRRQQSRESSARLDRVSDLPRDTRRPQDPAVSPHVLLLVPRCALARHQHRHLSIVSPGGVALYYTLCPFQWRSQVGSPGAPPPRNWVHKKILGCAVELNTENCAWFGSQISLITAISFLEAMPSPNHPPGALPLDPAGGPAIPLCPTSKSWLRHWSLQCFDAVGWAAGRASGL